MKLSKPHICLFVSDMDSTMIANECIDEMARLLDEKKHAASAQDTYFHRVQAITQATMDGAKLPFDVSLRQRIAILAEGGFLESWLEEVYARITPMEGAKELLNYLQAHHVYSVLVSGGFTFFAEKVASLLGFQEFHANVLEFTDGILSGVHGPISTDGTILDGAGKQHIMQTIMRSKHIPAHAVCAIGDGSNDADMVRAAGYGIAYRAKNETLLAAATYKVMSLHEVPPLLAGI